MAGKQKTSIRQRIGELLGSTDCKWLKESSPAELLRWLQLEREFNELGGIRPPKETTIRWIEPTED
jgi:hypothetical protein